MQDQVDPAAAALTAAQHLIAEHIAKAAEGTTGEKMLRVVERQASDLAAVGVDDPLESLQDHLLTLDTGERTGFLVEVFFLDPFAPYDLDHTKRRRRNALRELADRAGLPPEMFEQIESTADEAAGVHRQINWIKVGVVGVGGAALLGFGGFLAAPIIGTALGGAAGFAGAAATNFGLALLGGGALAAGGAGMAGGMWLVAGVGGAVGAAAGAGGRALFDLGAARAKVELLKLQVVFKLAVVDAQVDTIKAQEVLTVLNADLDEMRVVLEEERDLNDRNSARVKDLEKTLDALEAAVGWMEAEAG